MVLKGSIIAIFEGWDPRNPTIAVEILGIFVPYFKAEPFRGVAMKCEGV